MTEKDQNFVVNKEGQYRFIRYFKWYYIYNKRGNTTEYIK